MSIYLTIFGSRSAVTVPSSISAAVSNFGLSADTVAALVKAVAGGDTAAAAALPGVTSTILAAAAEGLNNGYAKAFKVVFLTTLGFGIPGIIAAFFVADVSEHFTHHVSLDLEEGRHNIKNA